MSSAELAEFAEFSVAELAKFAEFSVAELAEFRKAKLTEFPILILILSTAINLIF